jgi:hypothetical protein
MKRSLWPYIALAYCGILLAIIFIACAEDKRDQGVASSDFVRPDGWGLTPLVGDGWGSANHKFEVYHLTKEWGGVGGHSGWVVVFSKVNGSVAIAPY